MNRGRNPAVNLHEPVERLDGVRVTQNDGDLPALGAMRCLTLRAGLGLDHALDRRQPAHVLDALAVGLPAGQVFGDALAAGCARFRDGKRPLLALDSYQRSAFLAQAGGKGSTLGKDRRDIGLRLLVAANTVRTPLRNLARRPATNRGAIEADHERSVSVVRDGHHAAIPVQFLGHLVLHVGPVPTMCASYIVTSDVSTGAAA